jgi:hypothetical protein
MPIHRWSGLSRCYYAGYDVTGQTNAVEVQQTLDSPEVSAFGDAVKSYVTALNDSKATQKGFVTSPTTEAHRVLSARAGGTAGDVWTWCFGTSQADFGYAGSAVLVTEYKGVSDLGAASMFDAGYMPGPDSPGFDPVQIIAPLASRSTASPAGGVLAASGTFSSNGFRAYLQQTAVTAGTTTVVVQGSNDDATYTTLASFPASGTVSGAAVAAAGSVPGYLRASVSGGTSTFLVTVRRL